MAIVEEITIAANRVQNLDEALCILQKVYTFVKSTHPTIPPRVRITSRLRSLTFAWQPVQEKENFEFKPVK